MRWRLFVSFWLVLTLHFATNIVREHYPAMSLADHGTPRVDEYLGLHPDLFEGPDGRGYINNNPGVSFLAALPLVAFRPALDWAKAYGQRQRERGGTEVSAIYDDHRPNRLLFYRQVRERGLDFKFGLVAFLCTAFLMSPLTALAGVVMFDTLRERGIGLSRASLFSVLFVFGTPLFFRNAFLNHNHVLGLFVFFAFVLLWRKDPLPGPKRFALAGLLGGYGVLLDYSGVVPLLFLTVFALLEALRQSSDDPGGVKRRQGLERLGAFCLGAAVPILVLLLYQWWAFGSPMRLAQTIMPPTQYSMAGESGFTLPQLDLAVQNLIDPTFGIFAFGPLLLLAIPGVFVALRRGWFSGAEIVLIVGFLAVFLAFCSANQYARMQFNTGFRYLAPAVPLLFLLAAPLLERLPRLLLHAIVVLAIAHAWALAMVRESVPVSLLRVFVGGFELPWLTVIGKMATQYVPFLSTERPSPLPLFLLAAALLFALWKSSPEREEGRSR